MVFECSGSRIRRKIYYGSMQGLNFTGNQWREASARLICWHFSELQHSKSSRKDGISYVKGVAVKWLRHECHKFDSSTTEFSNLTGQMMFFISYSSISDGSDSKLYSCAYSNTVFVSIVTADSEVRNNMQQAMVISAHRLSPYVGAVTIGTMDPLFMLQPGLLSDLGFDVNWYKKKKKYDI